MAGGGEQKKKTANKKENNDMSYINLSQRIYEDGFRVATFSKKLNKPWQKYTIKNFYLSKRFIQYLISQILA